jgi:hypothetical protein
MHLPTGILANVHFREIAETFFHPHSFYIDETAVASALQRPLLETG